MACPAARTMTRFSWTDGAARHTAAVCGHRRRSAAGIFRPAHACYLLDEAALTRNAEILGGLARRTGCKVLLAQKAFSNYDLYPLLAPHLAGTEARRPV